MDKNINYLLLFFIILLIILYKNKYNKLYIIIGILIVSYLIYDNYFDIKENFTSQSSEPSVLSNSNKSLSKEQTSTNNNSQDTNVSQELIKKNDQHTK